MALSDKWTLSQLRTAVRRELLDSGASPFWTDTEINAYLNDWQDYLVQELEPVWGSATTTLSTHTATLTAVATDMLRVDAMYWNNRRLIERSQMELEVLQRDWRESNSSTPSVSFTDTEVVQVWPPPSTAGTVVFEYPRMVALTTDTTTMELPAWTKYSAKNYVGMRAYGRAGPNQDLNKAFKYKARFLRQCATYKTIKANYLPDRAPRLRPGGSYEGDILTGGKHSTLYKTWL